MEMDESGLLETCDCCNRLIINWNWMHMSFLDFDGKIRCIWCKSEFVKECVAKKEFDKIGCTELDFV